MLKEMKKGFGLLKYGYNVKTNIVCGILFMVLGLIMAFLLPDSFCLGSVYVLLGMLMCIQLQQTLLFSEMISASGKHRFLDVDFPSIVSGIISIGGYVFLSILRILAGVIYPEQKAACGEDLISLGIMAAVLMTYFGICYKIFVVGSVLFAVSFALAYFFIMNGWVRTIFYFADNTFTAFLIGFIIVIVSTAIACFLKLALRKKSLSPFAAGAALRKAMQ